MSLKPLAVLLFGCFAPLVSAQTVAPAYAATYSMSSLGPIAGLPTSYGGLTFVDANTILIGGSANNSAGLFYSVPVIRGAGGHIASFGAPVAHGYGAYNDGGVAFGPAGVLFYSKYSVNFVGQVKPGSNVEDKNVDLSSIGIPSSTGALNFVPPGFNGAGRLKISSYSGGEFFDVAYVADGAGTYNLTSATLKVTLPGAPEGFVYIPIGSPLFPSQSLLVSEYGADSVATYTIDANGDPVLASRADFVTGLNGAEGAAIDPVTGDFIFSTFGDVNEVYQVRGFVPPAPPDSITPVPTLSAWSLLALLGLIGLIGLAQVFRRDDGKPV
jgi:hypothetical protein